MNVCGTGWENKLNLKILAFTFAICKNKSGSASNQKRWVTNHLFKRMQKGFQKGLLSGQNPTHRFLFVEFK